MKIRWHNISTVRLASGRPANPRTNRYIAITKRNMPHEQKNTFKKSTYLNLAI